VPPLPACGFSIVFTRAGPLGGVRDNTERWWGLSEYLSGPRLRARTPGHPRSPTWGAHARSARPGGPRCQLARGPSTSPRLLLRHQHTRLPRRLQRREWRGLRGRRIELVEDGPPTLDAWRHGEAVGCNRVAEQGGSLMLQMPTKKRPKQMMPITPTHEAMLRIAISGRACFKGRRSG
jgi:hypothetical protein